MLVKLVHLALPLSIFCSIFALGLEATLSDAIFVLRRPHLLLRSLLAMNVVMVAFAVAVASFFHLDPALKIAIVVLAVSPVPPLLPRKNRKSGGSESYAVGLLVAAVLAAIVMTPAWIMVLGHYFNVKAHLPPTKILPILLISAIAPLLSGMLVHQFAPDFAARTVGPLSKAAGLLLLAAALPVLFIMAEPMWDMVGNHVLIVLAAFTLVGFLVGHLMGGPDPEERTVLALACSARHPGVAIAIIGLNFPNLKATILVVVIWHLLVALALTIPYKAWRRRVGATTP
jgi:BASS family bile acid:Na+ symporter